MRTTKTRNIKNRMLYPVIMIIILAISYWLSRFVFFEMHGMKDWPNLMALVSIIIIIIAYLAGKRMISLMTVLGYMGGFILAMIFNRDGLDPGGGRTNNAWIIWVIVLFVCLLIGLISEVFLKRKAHKQASSIAIIGGSDGPRFDFVGIKKVKKGQEKKWNQLLEVCKEIIIPKTNKITGEELKKYLIHEYDAREIELTDRNKKVLKYNVIMNYYPEALGELEDLENNKDDYKLNNDKDEDHFNNIELIPDKNYGLQFYAFSIPRTSKTERLYQEFEQEMKQHRYGNASLFSNVFNKPLKKTLSKIKEMEIEMELSTGYMTIGNGSSILMNEIILWKGITQEDIDTGNRAFISYAVAMSNTGEVVYCEKEGKWKRN